MRLLNTTQKIAGGFETKEFFDDALPDYAILSHTWGEEEVSYRNLKNGEYANMNGYSKIKECCSIARSRNIAWVWIDTCCIDKTSSAELTEAINSMYRWYQQAKVCYAFLEDVPARPFPESRWFTRGWTLQELIAPDTVVFLNRDWEEIGARDTLQREISECTGIPLTILSGLEELGAFSVAQRMSWASRRRTSRIEDRAYSLLGIFGINMPLIYGEGTKAFIRLQEEIIRTLEDYTIFAWKDGNSHGGLLELSPDAFADSAAFVPTYHPAFETKETWTVSNRGVQLRLPFMGIGPRKLGLAALNCAKAEKRTQFLAIYLRDISGTMQTLARVFCDTLEVIDEDNLLPSRFPCRRICVPQQGQFLQSGSKRRQRGISRCLEEFKTSLSSEISSSMGVEFFDKVAICGQRMVKAERIDERFPRTGGYSELAYAAHMGYIEHIQILLARGYDVNTLDYANRTALWAAAAAEQTLAVWLLMCRPNIDVNVPTSAHIIPSNCMHGGMTALSIATLRRHEEVVWLLLSRGDIKIYADPKEPDKRDPVMFAVADNHRNIVEMFLARDDFDVTREGLADEMLRVASIYGNVAMLEMLLGRIDLHDVKPAAGNVWTPEKYAARYGQEQIVELLLARGADINHRTPTSESMMEIASEYGQTAIVSLLLYRGVQFALAAMALKKAAEEEHMDIVRLLVDSSYGKLLLRDVVELFLMLSGARPQIISAWYENAQVLLSRGAHRIMHTIDVNRGTVPHIDMADGSGRTLLSWAAEHGQLKVVEALINHGADIIIKDNRGRTALDMARDGGHYAVVEVLQRKRRMDTDEHSGETVSWLRQQVKKRLQGQGSAS